MSTVATIHAIVRLPIAFSQRGDVSVIELLRESGYYQNYDRVRVADLRDALNDDGHATDAWVQYSEDQRSSSAWFVSEQSGEWYVGFYSSDEEARYDEGSYSTKVDATASFVKRMIESVRTRGASDPRLKGYPPRVDPELLAALQEACAHMARLSVILERILDAHGHEETLPESEREEYEKALRFIDLDRERLERIAAFNESIARVLDRR